MKIIGFTGGDGGKMAEPGMCDHLIKIPSKDTPRIQEKLKAKTQVLKLCAPITSAE